MRTLLSLLAMTIFTPLVHAGSPGKKPADYPQVGQTLRITGRGGKVGSQAWVEIPSMQFNSKTNEWKPGGSRLRISCSDITDENHHYSMGGLKGKLKDTLYHLFMISPGTGQYGYGRAYFIRPDAHHYYADERQAVIDRWDTLQPASTYAYQLDLVRVSKDRLEVWMDGRFFQYVNARSDAKSLSLRVQGGAGGSALAFRWATGSSPPASDRSRRGQTARTAPCGDRGKRRDRGPRARRVL